MTLDGFTGEAQDFELTVGSITGVRTFKQDGLGRLVGVTYDDAVFKPGVNRAVCGPYPNRRLTGDHLAGCNCGFYGYYADTPRQGHFDGTVGAIIRATGKTVIGTRGFRSEKAELVALFPMRKRGPVRKSPFRFLFPSGNRFLKWSRESRTWYFWAVFLLGGLGLLVASIGSLVATFVLKDPIGLLMAPVGAAAVVWAARFFTRNSAADEVVRLETGRLKTFGQPYTGDAERDLHRLTWGKSPLDSKIDKLSTLYPDVPFYRSRSAALKAHPVTVATEVVPPEPEPVDPTPENTDGFWEIPVHESLDSQLRAKITRKM